MTTTKMVQQQLCQETGNIVLLKDLSNIAITAKKGESRNDLDATVQVLMEKYGMRISSVHVIITYLIAMIQMLLCPPLSLPF